MLRHGGSQTCAVEGALAPRTSRQERRGVLEYKGVYMGGFFASALKEDCVFDLFFGTDYHSHLGTRRAGMAVYGKDGFNRAIHNIESSPFRTLPRGLHLRGHRPDQRMVLLPDGHRNLHKGKGAL